MEIWQIIFIIVFAVIVGFISLFFSNVENMLVFWVGFITIIISVIVALIGFILLLVSLIVATSHSLEYTNEERADDEKARLDAIWSKWRNEIPYCSETIGYTHWEVRPYSQVEYARAIYIERGWTNITLENKFGPNELTATCSW